MTPQKDLPVFNPAPVILLTALFLILLLLASCNRDLYDKEAFAGQLSAALKPADTGKGRSLPRMEEALSLTYQQRNYAPVWIGDKGVSGAVDQLLEDLTALHWDGLDTLQFPTAQIRAQAAALKGTQKPELTALLSFDTLCTRAYLLASRQLLLGRISPGTADSLWYNPNDSAWLAVSSLGSAKAGDYPDLAAYRSRMPGYTALQQELRVLSEHAGVPAQDSLRRIVLANLERLRWLPQEWEQPYIYVNIPQMELVVKNQDKDVLPMRVVVGRPSRQTPALSKPITNIVFNPSWGVPPTILKKDVLPGLTRSGEAYLKKKNLRAYDKNGNPVDADNIDESNYKNFVYRQPPGDDNALGLIKFNMPNVWNIYLHDTPNKSDFSQSKRDKSSGCVRVESARELASYILTELNGKTRFNTGRIDSVVSTHKTTYEKLDRKLAVHLVYLTAVPSGSGDNILYVPDIYNRDNRLADLLARPASPSLTAN